LALKESPVTTGESLFDLFELVMDREGLDWKTCWSVIRRRYQYEW